MYTLRAWTKIYSNVLLSGYKFSIFFSFFSFGFSFDSDEQATILDDLQNQWKWVGENVIDKPESKAVFQY